MPEIEFEPIEWIDLRDDLQDKHFIAASLDYSGTLLVLCTPDFVEYRYRSQNGNLMPRAKTSRPHDFAILEATSDFVINYTIPDQFWNYHFVQLLPDNLFLLACARTSKDDDLNACTFTQDGQLQNQFSLADGIEDVQTTKNGDIWVSYFDEGVYGSRGDDAPGSSGLVKWNGQGQKLYGFQPKSELGPIDDCYALNVETPDITWLYYYKDFPLVRLSKEQIDQYWWCPVRGASYFAIWGDVILFCNGYYEINRFYLYELSEKHQMKRLATYKMKEEKLPTIVASRGDTIISVKDGIFYRTTIQMLLDWL